MAENQIENPDVSAQEVQEQTPPQKAKSRAEKVKIKLTGAASCNYNGLILKKDGVIELNASQAENFLKSGLFERV